MVKEEGSLELLLKQDVEENAKVRKLMSLLEGLWEELKRIEEKVEDRMDSAT